MSALGSRSAGITLGVDRQYRDLRRAPDQERNRVVHGSRRLATSVPRDQDSLADGFEGAIARDDEHGSSDTQGQLFREEGEIIGRILQVDSLPDDREVGVSGVKLRRPDDRTRIDPPFAANPAPSCSLVEQLLGPARELLELATLFVQEVRRQLGLDVARQPGPSHRVESREVRFVCCRQRDCHVHP